MKVIVVYASAGGNTRETAHRAADGASAAGAEVDLYNVYQLEATILLEADAILAGEPTYGDGDHHGDFIPFDKGMADLLVPQKKLLGRPAAAFVGCDRAYKNFGRAIELIENRLVECGAQVVQKGLKIELKHNDASKEFTRRWGMEFVRRAKGELAWQPFRPAMTPAEADSVMGITR